ncbi:putative leucine-rich repeat-containing protein DDB_G0281931 [Orbicella faveolata]|uniref:putative leucine-rich repeat-containing protein DDB_G0281931 n=1 Tax=Orbicella faveolata TaxID=48498 RepID=UPI0009E20CA0|nr:putative leucine-rich repeat-containing protein DDB_G0281931 [Orbicella faveolata]
MCPAGGFYQDQMGQIDCKTCSNGTFVSEKDRPGTSAVSCRACPYGTQSNVTAGYRACRCLRNLYRLDRFGACSACPAYGFVCENDTAILAPNYFWKWSDQTLKERYGSFVNNIHTFGPEYNNTFSTFTASLPKPIKCPHANSCKGGINSECQKGYKGILCASCTNGFYFRFNNCLKCPRLTVTIISSILLVVLFVAVFLMVLWGDSKQTENDRTIADIIMSCFKIVIGFYQVIAGIFSALTRVRWPVALISMEKYLNLFEGNILQFAPLSCIHSQLRMDQFAKFLGIISLNVVVVFIILLYLFLKKRYVKTKVDIPDSEKLRAVSSLKKSCYRNIFLFLLTSYSTTSKTIIQTLPLPGACVETCFTDEKGQCNFFLRADYSIQCFTPRHNFFWPIAAVFAFYPLGFPLLVLSLMYKYRESQEEEEISFGLKVFFENYKKKFWFWEITEMYRKLILISLVFLFGSESPSQISFTMLTVSAFGVAYTFFRPIKGKFEDRLQTFVLWVIFFDVCLGVVYTNWRPDHQDQMENDSVVLNVIFVLLNASVLLFAIGKYMG